MENDYQRPEGCPEPEGGTRARSPYLGWLRASMIAENGWLNKCDWRTWKATAMIHSMENKEKK
jgi:hypothetical protein